ncbi:MAG: hypothetical protein CL878_09225 [Dehalococcoidia bacterium]|nr:hypothetical protein [Dehalococcoidia bacterium]
MAVISLRNADREPTVWGPSRCLIAATALAGFVGVPLGALLGYWSTTGQVASVPWVGLIQAHGQVQLFGWLGLAILGVTFHAMANLFRTREAPDRMVHVVLALQVVGIALRVAAPFTPAAPSALGAWVLVGSATALLAAFAFTLAAHVQTLPRRDPSSRGPAVLPRFLLVGLMLWLVALLVNLDGAINALRLGLVAPGALSATRDALIVAAMTNGLPMIALGMSLRVVVGWTDLPTADLGRAAQAWWPLTLAVLLRAAVPGVEVFSETGGHVVTAVGGLLWGLGVFWYLPVLRGLWSSSSVRVGGGAGGEADPPLAWFVRTAYGWFVLTGVLAAVQSLLAVGQVAGLVTSPPSTIADVARHALLLGYLGTLTAGLSGRLPSAFLDVGDAALAGTGPFYRAAWLLLLTATVLRVIAPLAGEAQSWLVAASGMLGALALWSLLVVMVRIALAATQREQRRGATP